jgi:hypothetical protein
VVGCGQGLGSPPPSPPWTRLCTKGGRAFALQDPTQGGFPHALLGGCSGSFRGLARVCIDAPCVQLACCARCCSIAERESGVDAPERAVYTYTQCRGARPCVRVGACRHSTASQLLVVFVSGWALHLSILTQLSSQGSKQGRRGKRGVCMLGAGRRVRSPQALLRVWVYMRLCVCRCRGGSRLLARDTCPSRVSFQEVVVLSADLRSLRAGGSAQQRSEHTQKCCQGDAPSCCTATAVVRPAHVCVSRHCVCP